MNPLEIPSNEDYGKCTSFEFTCEPIQPPPPPDEPTSILNYNKNPIQDHLDSSFHQLSNDFLLEELEESQESTSHTFNAKNSPPIYHGAPLTLHESLVSVLTLALRYSMSGQLIQGVLKLIDLHLPRKDNIFPSSLYLFHKYFSEIKGSASYTNYCGKCFTVCDKKKGCPCGNKKAMCSLVQLSLIEQLQTLFKRKGFYESLIPIDKRRKESGIHDIFDGEMYKLLLEKGYIKNPQDLSFLWYTDGAALFESSSISVWTVYLTINELPYSERFKKENLLVPALWIGPVKPNGNILLNAAVPDLKRLRDGVNFDIAGVGNKEVKACVLCGTADTPARALMLNMVAHNGEFACQRCEQKGECREGCNGVRVFPYLPEEMTPRSSASSSRQGYLSLLLKDNYLGFKGPTTLNKISPDFIRGCGIDSMHMLFGGIGKLNVKFFVDNTSAYSSLKCNLSKVMKETANSRLMQIRPPHYMTRTPRSLHDVGSWQTSLHKSMLLHYGLPVLQGLISTMHMKHYSTLVAAVQYLNSDNVSHEDLLKAEQLITKYVAYFEDIYSRKFMTINVHLLLHLVEVVKDLGPLWVTSCFPQEGINGSILKLVHGTRFPEMQITSSLNMCLGLPDIIESLPDSKSKEFCEKVTSKTHNYKSFKFGDNTIVGLWHPLNVEDYLHKIITESILMEHITQFHCLRRRRELIAAESYARSTQRDSSSVMFSHNGESKVGLQKEETSGTVGKKKEKGNKVRTYKVLLTKS
ncbi:hypothetical protein FOCC_FOCC015685 [Frankliniella occidentalis]|nr:hypothetical protein FOCC_FOCC015685 [Frankliniella occidentalis]